jgi:two-component system OmpR family sensor kinase
VRSLSTRLALLFLAITAAAIGVVYVYVAPPLQSALREERLRGLATLARKNQGPIARGIDRGITGDQLKRRVVRAAEAAGTRVTLLNVSRGTEGVQVSPTSDSFTENAIEDLQFAVAQEAARTGRTRTGTEAGSTGRIGEAALPLFFRRGGTGRRQVGRVVVFSAPLNDVEANVALIRRRILEAGFLALGGSLIAGFFVAAALSRRIRGLEKVAGRVAAGDFTARFPVEANDEIGRLARALDDMQSQLAELDSARKRFIAVASHELRTPIFSLGGFLELLADEELSEEERAGFLAQVRLQVDRLGKLATDLLDLSKLEAGSLELRPEATDLSELARSVAQEFAPSISAHSSQLELRLPAESVQAVCDPERVAQVMRILIDNALKHTPPGTDMVVTAVRRDQRVRLGVGDFGPGVHRSMLPQIFEPFITSDDAQGSGLGLAIAHELAERMSGDLRVQSQPGRTTFTLDLPAGPAPVSA